MRNTPVQLQGFTYTLLEPIEKGGFGQIYIVSALSYVVHIYHFNKAAMHTGDKFGYPFVVKICDFLEIPQTRGLEFGNLRQLRCERYVYKHYLISTGLIKLGILFLLLL